MVFTGLDDEEAPKAGGIFMAPLTDNPTLTTIAGFQTIVPKNQDKHLVGLRRRPVLRRPLRRLLGRMGYGYVREAGPVRDGRQRNGPSGLIINQDNSGVAKDGIYTFNVLQNQGIFLADTLLNKLFLVAQTGEPVRRLPVLELLGQCGPGRWR